MSLQTHLNDKAARDQAIDPMYSYGVSAPAGSGKTELLIQRTLSLLATVEHPEAILGITFTRKAANEMRERVMSALKNAAENRPLNSDHEQLTRNLASAVLARNEQLDWGLLENSSRLRFQTIDGLCRQLANQLCLETGIIVPPSMSDDSLSLYQIAAEKTLDSMDETGPVGDALRLVIAHLDGNLEKFVSLVAELLSSRDSWLKLVFSGDITSDYLSERIEALIDESLTPLNEFLTPYASDINGLLDYAVAHKQGANYLHPSLDTELPDANPFNLSQWKAIRAFFVTGKVNQAKYRSSIDKRMGFPTESDQVDKATAKLRKQEYAELIALFEETPEILIRLNRLAILPDTFSDETCDQQENTEAITRALFTLLPKAAAEFNLLSQEIGETDFTGVAIAALQALGTPEQPTPLALRLDYRIQHILVDEFQDTSSVQIRLLECLTAGWEPDDGRTLFIVGDGMQSIYGFRKANVSLFIRARREGIGHIHITPLDLTANFRSDQQVVDWVNHSFSNLFPAQDNLVQGQVAFKQADAVKSASNWAIQQQGFASPELEARSIAKDIESKLDNSDDSIAILVRSRSHLEAILPELRARNIQWQAQDIDPLANRMAVIDIHSLTRALCVPADRIAWLAVLRAPWAGLDTADMLALCQWHLQRENELDESAFQPIWLALQSAAEIPTLSIQGKRIAQRLRLNFGAAFDHLGKRPLRQVLETLWNTLDGKSGLLEPRDVQDIEDYLCLVEKHENAGSIPDWQAFERRLNELYSQPENTPTVRLQIMTIHKSKGLEFDHVYLPQLNRITGRNPDPLLLWWEREYEDGSEGYLLASKPAMGASQQQSLYDYLKAEERERQKQEVSRLLYVACTRARKSLFLSATLNWDEKKEQVRKPADGSMLSALWGISAENFSTGYLPPIESQEEPLLDQPKNIIDGIRRLDPYRASRTEDAIKTLTETSIETTEKTAVYERTSLFSENYIARITGELIHHSLMRIVREGLSSATATDFKADWIRELLSSGLENKQQIQITHKLQSMLDTVLADSTGRWILDKHQEDAAELEMDYLDSSDSVQRAIIDRTFIEDGTRWIIDYKSSSPSSSSNADEPLPHFLAREAKEYRQQMTLYASLFKHSGTPCRAMLYFPAVSASIEIEHL